MWSCLLKAVEKTPHTYMKTQIILNIEDGPKHDPSYQES